MNLDTPELAMSYQIAIHNIILHQLNRHEKAGNTGSVAGLASKIQDDYFTDTALIAQKSEAR